MHVLGSTISNRNRFFEPQDMLRQPRASLIYQTFCVLGLKETMLTPECAGEGELLGFLLETI